MLKLKEVFLKINNILRSNDNSAEKEPPFNPNLGRGGGGVILSPAGFPLITQKWRQKAVTLAFCSIQEHFIRDIHAKFGIPNSPPSPDIRQISDGGISYFQILVNPF